MCCVGEYTNRRIVNPKCFLKLKSVLCDWFVFTVCGARYKTRPGLTYHVNHSHKDGANSVDRSIMQAPPPHVPPPAGPPPMGGPMPHPHMPGYPPQNVPPRPPPQPSSVVPGQSADEVHEEGASAPSSVGGSSLTPPSTPGVSTGDTGGNEGANCKKRDTM